jgi:hypothetical protein
VFTCLLLTFAAPAPAAALVEDGIAMVAESRATAREAAPRGASAAADSGPVVAPPCAAQTLASSAVDRVVARLYLLNCALLR